MSDPNASEALDETLVQANGKPTHAPQVDPTGDFSLWSWTAAEPPSQPLPLTQTAAVATPELSAPHTLDETLVQSMLAGKAETKHAAEEPDQTLIHAPDADNSVVARFPDRAAPPTEGLQEAPGDRATTAPEDRATEALDQTLVHAADEQPVPVTSEATMDGTLVKPTVAPHRAETRVPSEPDFTLVNPPESAADPHATECESEPPSVRKTEPIGPGRPTGHLNPTAALTNKAARQGPSFQPTGDRYDIQGTLGRGGMGVVYKARDKQLNRLVALKMILSGAHASPETLLRFKIEAEAVARLQHPNIVQIFDSGVRDGHPYFSLEYLDGGSLHQRLDGKAQPAKQVAFIIETLARAMHYAHLHGIVHRDLKPANVLLAKDGTLKITDFGLAKQLDAEDSGQTGTEAILGTPTYMAPEQAAGRTKEVGPAADVYALGAMLYEMLTGRPPFRGNTVMETLQQVQHVEPIQPRRLQPNAPLDLQTICLKCLNKEPHKRYASAEALADDLRAYLDDRPIKARPISTPERMYKWMRRQPMQAALVFVCVGGLAGLIAGVGHSMYQQSELRQIAEDKAATETKARKDAEQAKATIQQERDDKEKARADAVQNERQATKNAELAEKNEERAKENFKQAQAAVDQLTVLAQQSLVDRPGLEKVRDDLLNRVVQFYEEFNKTNQGAALTLEKTRAYRRLGNVQQLLGKNDQAAASYRTACDAYAGLLAMDDKDETSRRERAETLINLWTVLEDLGKPEAAVEALNQAHQELEHLHAEHPDKWAYLLDLAMCDDDLGIHASNAGQWDPAVQHLQEALTALGKIKDPDAKRPSVQLELARAQSNLGLIYTKRAQSAAKPDEDYEKAADLLVKAINIIKPLTLAAPETTDYAKELGEVYTNLGTLHLARKDQAAALITYTEAIDLFDGLRKKYPDVTDYRHLLALNQSNRGDLLGQQKQFDAARADLQAAVDTLTQLVAGFRNRPVYRLELARAYNRLAVIDEATGQHQSAQATWERADKLLADVGGASQSRDEYRLERKRTLDYLTLLHMRDAAAFFKAKRWPDAAEATAKLVAVEEEQAALFPSAQTKGDLASTRLHLAEMYVAAGNTAEADKAVTEFWNHRKDIPRGWGKLYRAAVVVCQLMELADHDKNLSPEEVGRIRKAHTDQCLLLLRDAIDQNEDIVVGPEDFKALGDNQDLKEMLAEIQRKHKKAGEAP